MCTVPGNIGVTCAYVMCSCVAVRCSHKSLLRRLIRKTLVSSRTPKRWKCWSILQQPVVRG
jgi:hypothetical protein